MSWIAKLLSYINWHFQNTKFVSALTTFYLKVRDIYSVVMKHHYRLLHLLEEQWMKQVSDKPLILLIFANDKRAYLEGIVEERKNLIDSITPIAERLKYEIKSLDFSSVESVLEALNTNNKRLFLLHFAGHSGTDFLSFDRGAAYASGITAKLKECINLKLVFLNGCNNIDLVRSLKEINVPYIIGTKKSIADKAAKTFSTKFFDYLTDRNVEIHDAYKHSINDIAFLQDKSYRSLDTSSAEIDEDWAWIDEFSANKWKFDEEADYCNRLPALKQGELPRSPFKNLYYYTEKDAQIFFGRCKETFKIINILENSKEPILVIAGGTGVGKTSFLQAGLIPRLKSSSNNSTINYYRFDEKKLKDNDFEGFEPLKKHLVNDNPKPSGNDSESHLYIYDQFEEFFYSLKTNPPQDEESKITDFLSLLNNVFYPVDSKNRPKVKLIISLRKSWIADLEHYFDQGKINYKKILITPLDQKAIKEIIESPTKIDNLKSHFALKIKKDQNNHLSSKIASDILSDKESNVAPSLQIVLSRMWDKVKHQDDKTWSESLYLEERKNGFSLDKHIDLQFEKIEKEHKWGERYKNNGLLLDILYSHTSQQGNAKTLSKDERLDLYPHIEELDEITLALKESYLLIELESDHREGKTRVSHDTLASQVKLKYEQSEQIGHKTRKILNNRRKDWHFENNKYKGPKLDSHDLKIIKKGRFGTQDWKNNELERSIYLISRKSNLMKNTIQLFTGIFSMVLLAVIIYITIQIPKKRAENRIAELSVEVQRLSGIYLDRPLKLKPESLTAVVGDLSSISNDIGIKYQFTKHTSISKAYLLASLLFKHKDNSDESLAYAKNSIEHSLIANQLFSNNTGDANFAKFIENSDGNPPDNRNHSNTFNVIHGFALKSCNGDKDAATSARQFISEIPNDFLYNHIGEKDLCLKDFLK